MLYNAFVRRRLEYCAAMWDPYDAEYCFLIFLSEVGTVNLNESLLGICIYKRMYGYYPMLVLSLYVYDLGGCDTLEDLKDLVLQGGQSRNTDQRRSIFAE